MSNAVRFSDEEIEAARRLRRSGVPWEPAVGHYVYDEMGIVEQASPFQEKVYFILNYAYFMRLVGGVERFKEHMLWLPTYEDLRGLLRERGVSDAIVQRTLIEQGAIENGRESQALYELIASSFSNANDMSVNLNEASRS